MGEERPPRIFSLLLPGTNRSNREGGTNFPPSSQGLTFSGRTPRQFCLFLVIFPSGQSPCSESVDVELVRKRLLRKPLNVRGLLESKEETIFPDVFCDSECGSFVMRGPEIE